MLASSQAGGLFPRAATTRALDCAWADLSVAQKMLGRAAESRKSLAQANKLSKDRARERLARWSKHFKAGERVVGA